MVLVYNTKNPFCIQHLQYLDSRRKTIAAVPFFILKNVTFALVSVPCIHV